MLEVESIGLSKRTSYHRNIFLASNSKPSIACNMSTFLNYATAPFNSFLKWLGFGERDEPPSTQHCNCYCGQCTPCRVTRVDNIQGVYMVALLLGFIFPLAFVIWMVLYAVSRLLRRIIDTMRRAPRDDPKPICAGATTPPPPDKSCPCGTGPATTPTGETDGFFFEEWRYTRIFTSQDNGFTADPKSKADGEDFWRYE